MSIVVAIETERHREVKALVDEDGHLARIAARLRPSTLLGAIDPYGQTMFNRLQIPIIRDEIAAQIASPEGSPGEHEFLRQVAALAQQAEKDGPHLYLSFHGD